jgi:hypothetical protein
LRLRLLPDATLSARMRLSMRCSLLLLAALCSICLVAAQSAPYLTITNPLLQGDMADPDVVRIDEGGEVFYLLTHTVGSGPDIREWSNLIEKMC